MSDKPSAATIEAWERHLGEPVDPSELHRRLAAGNLSRAFHEAAVEAGERPALTIEGESATHRELDRLASRLGAWIRGRGVRPGDRVILVGPGSLGLVVAYLGILRAEAVAVLGGPDATERELSHLLSNSGAVAAFAGGDVCERLRALERAGLAPAVVSLDRGACDPTLEEALGSADVLPPTSTASRASRRPCSRERGR